ncbi:MAG: ABC transporter ATP-binding protein [Chthoniobacteraceae bacterium]
MKLQVQDLEKAYPTRKGVVQAVCPTSFEVGDGEFVSLVGPSGCGKSTTLYMLSGLEEATSGRILLDGKEVRGPGADRGMVFQNYTLFPWLTVLENVQFSLGLEANFRPGEQTTAEIMKLVGRSYFLLDLMGLHDFYDAYPRELSGGMKQRVAIARALVNQPKILLMDEPFGALDAQTREEMQEMLALLSQYEKTTIIFVTHDVEEAIFLSSRILVFSSRPGRIVSDIPVPFGRDERTLDLKLEPEFMRMKREIMTLLHGSQSHKAEDRKTLLEKLVQKA